MSKIKSTTRSSIHQAPIVILILLIINLCSNNENLLVHGKKSTPSSSSHRRSSSSVSHSGSNKKKKSSPKQSSVLPRFDSEDEDDYDIEDDGDEEKLDFLDEDEVEEEEYDEEEEEIITPKKRSQSSSSKPQQQRPKSKSPSSRSGSRKPSRHEEEDDYESEDDVDEYDMEEEEYRRPPSQSQRRRPPPRQNNDPRVKGKNASNRDKRSSSRHHVVPYTKHKQQQPGSITRSITFLRDSLPSPTNFKDSTISAISSAKDKTTKLSKDFYREVKGLTSSELEQVMLKATTPNDSPIKSKHVERLVGVTYQISGRYDIYDAVLRKLWNKMAEFDWRTKLKALYILHRFSADGSPEHQAALKARLRELRRTKDPKRKGNYFNSKQILSTTPTSPKQSQSQAQTDASIPYRAFLARYAHYVLLRAQCFSGMFQEITTPVSTSKGTSKKSSNTKSSNATPLKQEHLQAAQLLLKAACACQFQSQSEECETTSIALERVAMDLMGLTSAVASALNTCLKSTSDKTDRMLLKKWCEFYSLNLRPQTKTFVKKASVSLDKYGLFLPSRMSVSVSQELLTKGLQFSEEKEEEEEKEELKEVKKEKVKEEKEEVNEEKKEAIVEDKEEEEEDVSASVSLSTSPKEKEIVEEEEEEEDEYEYDDEEEEDEYDDEYDDEY